MNSKIHPGRGPSGNPVGSDRRLQPSGVLPAKFGRIADISFVRP